MAQSQDTEPEMLNGMFVALFPERLWGQTSMPQPFLSIPGNVKVMLDASDSVVLTGQANREVCHWGSQKLYHIMYSAVSSVAASSSSSSGAVGVAKIASASEAGWLEWAAFCTAMTAMGADPVEFLRPEDAAASETGWLEWAAFCTGKTAMGEDPVEFVCPEDAAHADANTHADAVADADDDCETVSDSDATDFYVEDDL